MTTIAKIKPGQFPQAAHWNALAEAYNGGTVGATATGSRSGRRQPPKGKNNSGSDRARFECMSIDGLEIALTSDGQVDLLFDLDDADPSKPPAILVEAIADGRVGEIIVEGLALALVGAAAAATDVFAVPDAANDRLAPQATEAAIRLLAAPDTGSTKLLPCILNAGGGGSQAKIVLASSGIAARSGTTVGSATCTEYKITSGTTLATNTNTITVKNPWPFAIPSGLYIVAVREAISSEWVALHPGVMDVAWNDPDLEQTLDGSNYSTIDTAQDCS